MHAAVVQAKMQAGTSTSDSLQSMHQPGLVQQPVSHAQTAQGTTCMQ